ncbi:unnamed protein product [Candida verbasci]|uniref:Vacuolar membrane protein n=1 Tax=Candida verbasci TaxID=1227364 RepID=A0A9W4TRC0_9ASCO|nr:unnamed protein product [Candida verbasci]
MPIQLQDDIESNRQQLTRPNQRFGKEKDFLVRLVNSVRCHDVPLLNFIIILILSIFLYKLTIKYSNLYMKSSLITIIITNLVLYGISETMAQSILCFDLSQPMLNFKLNDPMSNIQLDADEEQEEVLDDNASDISEEGLNRFINYLRDDNEVLIGESETPMPVVPLTFFQFNRLAGFMCWGFIMGIVQCFWYQFLQIYSKDPKFIEVLRKVLTDQLCFSPISLICFFTYGTIILENGDWEAAKNKLSKVYLKTLIINYSVWFPIQFINFLLIPRHFQVPFSSSISVLWNCFLSMRNSTN